MPLITVYKIIPRHGKDDGVGPREELGEKLPRHADMLRYDLAFYDPANISRVVFPVFDGKNGRSTTSITHARWQSWSFQITPENEREQQYIENLNEWITYRHLAPGSQELVPVTLAEYLAQHKDTRLKLAKRHR